jgi:hypothetical protein
MTPDTRTGLGVEPYMEAKAYMQKMADFRQNAGM